MSLVTLETPDGPLRADLDRPIDVSIPLRFDGSSFRLRLTVRPERVEWGTALDLELHEDRPGATRGNMLSLIVGADHRVFDAEPIGRFLACLDRLFQNPAELLL